MNTKAIHDQNNEVFSTGVRLRNAREQLGLSQKDVAERLCLKVSTIRDIEEDKAPIDLDSTFLRGYIRSYAKLVSLPEDELLLMMDKQTPIQAIKVSPMQSFSLGRYRKKCNNWLIILSWLVLFVVIILTSTWWWKNHKAQQKEISTMIVQSSDKLNGKVDTDKGEQKVLSLNTGGVSAASKLQTVTKNAFKGVESVQPTTSAVTANVQMVVQNDTTVSSSQDNFKTVPMTTNSTADTHLLTTNQSSVTVPAGPHELVMNFTSDCWLEVTDITGKKLFSGLQRKNNKLNFTGQTTYKLKIGAPSAVQIQFQGKPVDLSSFIKTNQVAQLTVNAK